MIIVDSIGITDVGCKRSGNEDNYFVSDTLGLYIVADGMGGHQAGEVASEIVVETVKSYIEQFSEGNEPDEYNEYDETLSDNANKLISAIKLANKSVFSISQSKKECRGMGSTVSAIWFTEDSFIAANVGDSPIYYIHGDSIELLSVPHTVMAEQSAMAGDNEIVIDSKYSHMLTRGMGIHEDVSADICENQCFKKNFFVICSDGLSDKVSPDEIHAIVSSNKPDLSASKLVDLAKDRGGEDNITVIILQVKKVRHNNSSGPIAWLLDKLGI